MLHETPVPAEIMRKWQGIVDLLADIVRVPSALIMRVEPPNIKVLIASETKGNPYEPDEEASLNTGLDCETVMSTRRPLLGGGRGEVRGERGVEGGECGGGGRGGGGGGEGRAGRGGRGRGSGGGRELHLFGDPRLRARDLCVLLQAHPGDFSPNDGGLMSFDWNKFWACIRRCRQATLILALGLALIGVAVVWRTTGAAPTAADITNILMVAIGVPVLVRLICCAYEA